MLDNYFQAQFPELFRHLGDRNCPYPIKYGIECQIGWKDLLVEMCEKLKELGDPDLFFLQVKEKFGMLRVTLSKAGLESHKVIVEAETRSQTICERCGAETASLQKVLRYETICCQCFQERAQLIQTEGTQKPRDVKDV